MKSPGRIVIILVTFAIIMGITYVALNAVSAGSSFASTNPPVFERGGENFPARDGERPEFAGAGPRGGGWIFGLVRNIGILAIIVVMIVVPKRFMRTKAVPAQVK